MQGDGVRAMPLYNAALSLSRESGDRHQIAWVLDNLGEFERERGHYARATALLDESIALRRELGEVHGVAMALLRMGQLAQQRLHRCL
jgi:tetratricopeptide (TPR) repeat protein